MIDWERFKQVMQNFNTYGKGRSLRSYCKDEDIDYKWVCGELTVVGNMMGECVNEFINMKISRKMFDERMSTYADRIETARRDEDRLLAAFGEIIQKIQENTESGTPSKPKNKKKNKNSDNLKQAKIKQNKHL